jgi:predicted anti-sigma-YlaC factor YlaD
MPTDANKAIGAGSGGGIGGALAVILIALAWPKADATVAAALTTLFSAATAYAGAYLTPHSAA